MPYRLLLSLLLALLVTACSTPGNPPPASPEVRSSRATAGEEGRGRLSSTLSSTRPPRSEPVLAGRVAPDAVIKLNPDSQQLTRDAEALLQVVAQQARSDEKLILRLESYVPAGGSPALNLGIAEKSVQAVKARLLELRVPARRIQLAPFGEEHRTKRDPLLHWVEIYMVRPRL